MASHPEDALVRRATALAGGLTDAALRRDRESGALASVARGVYLPAAELEVLDARQRHQIRLAAVVPDLGGEPVVSHLSAAVLHRLPFTHSAAPQVHVTRPAASRSRRTAGVYGHRGALADDEVTIIGGLAVTSAARTVLDCARMLALPHGVAVADAALHRDLTTPQELARLFGRQRRRTGNPRAAAVLAIADGRSASAWESHTRVALVSAGAPIGELAMPVVDRDGAPLGVAAFGYPDERVVVRYHPDGSSVDPDADARDLPPEEPLEAAGYREIGWGWAGLAYPDRLAGLVGTALSGR